MSVGAIWHPVKCDGTEVRVPLDAVRTREAEIRADRDALINVALTAAARRYEQRHGHHEPYDVAGMASVIDEQALALRDAADALEGRTAVARRAVA